jgi:hypothetical protein
MRVNGILAALVVAAICIHASAGGTPTKNDIGIHEVIRGGGVINFPAPVTGKKVIMTGLIIGPIAKQAEDLPTYKAFHIKFDGTVSIRGDDGACGDQDVSSIPISQAGVNKMLGKTVLVTGELSCHPSLGMFHLTNVELRKI